MDKKTYTPYVPIGSIRKNMDKANFDIDIVELFNADGTKKSFGEIPLFQEEQQRELEPAGKL